MPYLTYLAAEVYRRREESTYGAQEKYGIHSL